MNMKRSAGLTSSILLLAGILLIAANLRAPITGVAPVLDMIRQAFALGTAEAGALTTLPLLAFAIASPFCVLLAREYGLERSLFIALVLIAGGIVLRSLGAVWTLFMGTGIIGVGIAIANVLLPSLLKREFPDRIATLTSLYALVAGVVAAIASAAAVPIATIPGSGWNWALAMLLPFPLVAMLLWAPQLAARSAPTSETATPPHGGPVWYSALAWQVTLFFGLDALVYYVVVTWLPAILTDAGYSAASAGSIHGVSQLATAVPGLFLGPVVNRLKDQKGGSGCHGGHNGAVVARACAAARLGDALGGAVRVWHGRDLHPWSDLHQSARRQCPTGGCPVRHGAGHRLFSGRYRATTCGPVAGQCGGCCVPLLLCAMLCCAMAAFGYRAGRSIHIV